MLSGIGEAKYTGDRLAAIDWTDLLSWVTVTGASISPGEAEVLIMLSSTYVAQYYTDGNSPMVVEADRDEVAHKLEQLFAMLRKPK